MPLKSKKNKKKSKKKQKNTFFRPFSGEERKIRGFLHSIQVNKNHFYYENFSKVHHYYNARKPGYIPHYVLCLCRHVRKSPLNEHETLL